MDPVQLTIVIVSLVLTILVIVVSIQVWFILKEFRLTVQKINKMLDDMGRVTGTVGQGVENLGGLVSGVKAGLSFFSSLRRRESENE